MIDNSTRPLLKQPNDKPNVVTDLLYFPDHLACYEELGRRMNREAHQLINLVRSNVVMQPKAKPKQELKTFKPEAIATAVVDTTIDPTNIQIVALDEFLEPLMHRMEVTEDCKLTILLTILPSKDEERQENLAILDEITTLKELVVWYSSLEELPMDLQNIAMVLGRRYTELVNQYLKATISADISIYNFFGDYLELLDSLADNGFDEFEKFMDDMTLRPSFDEELPKVVEKCLLLTLDKSSDDMGFSQLTNEMFVTLSRVYHPTLLDLLDKCYHYSGMVPRATLILNDDTFTLFKSSVPGASWGITRAA